MSGLYSSVQVRVQSELRTGSSDWRYFALGDDLTPLGITVASLVSVVVTRIDGTTLGPEDLQILTNPAPYVGSDQLTIYWKETGSLVATYKITVTVTTSDGRTLIYDCLQPVTNLLS